MNKVKVRYPPAPSGELHIGNIRTMLFNYLFARKNDGEIVLRFEDTNKEKSKKEYEEVAIQTLNDLGLTYDEGPFRQSERTATYTARLATMVENGQAYEAEENNDGTGKVIRFKNPNKEVVFDDIVRGEIKINSTDFGDFVVARSMNDPIYHLTVVVDDIEMGITHVIRGEDHITSTPRQILLIEALGASVPQYAHLPLIIGEDKKKLGKRHGATSWSEFKAMGYPAEALVNHLALLGWNPGDEREIFSMDELVKEFSLEKVGKNPAMFDYIKLNDISKQYIEKMSVEEFEAQALEYLKDGDKKFFEKDEAKTSLIMSLVVKERTCAFGDINAMLANQEFDYYFEAPVIDKELVQFKDEGIEKGQELTKKIIEKFEAVSEENWNKEYLKELLWDWSGEVGRGSVLHPMRTVLSGAKNSPDPFTLSAILGKNETIKRLNTYVGI